LRWRMTASMSGEGEAGKPAWEGTKKLKGGFGWEGGALLSSCIVNALCRVPRCRCEGGVCLLIPECHFLGHARCCVCP
jgi:hypothetical protein